MNHHHHHRERESSTSPVGPLCTYDSVRRECVSLTKSYSHLKRKNAAMPTRFLPSARAIPHITHSSVGPDEGRPSTQKITEHMMRPPPSTITCGEAVKEGISLPSCSSSTAPQIPTMIQGSTQSATMLKQDAPIIHLDHVSGDADAESVSRTVNLLNPMAN